MGPIWYIEAFLMEKSLATDKGDGITGDEIVACLER